MLVAASTLLAISCSQGSTPTAAHTPTAIASPSATASATASPTTSPSPVPVAASYGLLLAGGKLEMITPDGLVGPSVSLAPSTLQTCVAGLNANLEPPVSATADKVFYRDGDTNIRYLTPAGQTGEATTVPGSATTVSFFSVSPDDQRIAVLVEDFSPSTFIRLGLYVEDLNGRGNHLDIYSTTTSKGPSATTLWPMGWHQGNLVLAQVKGCTNDPDSFAPSEWHLASASTGARLATIKAVAPSKGYGGAPITAPCGLSYWPSVAGVACVADAAGQASVFDWTGKLTATVPGRNQNSYSITRSGLSASGQRIFLATAPTCNGVGDYPPLPSGAKAVCPALWTFVNTSFRQGGVGYSMDDASTGACLWIDETHLLAADSVITVNATSAVRNALPVSGVCAGRYPGGL